MNLTKAVPPYIQAQQRAMEAWVAARPVIEYVILAPHDPNGTSYSALPRRIPRIE